MAYIHKCIYNFGNEEKTVQFSELVSNSFDKMCLMLSRYCWEHMKQIPDNSQKVNKQQ